MTDPIWVSEADVVASMHMRQAIEALEIGLRSEAAGTARNMVKAHLTWGQGNTLHAIGAVDEVANVCAAKSWAHTAAGATPLLILWEAQTGALLAIIEAFALGQMRTGAMSGVATRVMAAPDADTMAIIGTGKQAIAQVAAVAAVRDLTALFVYSPSPDSRARFCEQVRTAGFAFEVVDCATLQQATSAAAIITLVTRATGPFLTSDLPPKGSHINAVGAITPERQEFAQPLFTRAHMLAVDNVPATRALSAEFIGRFGNDDAAWSQVRRICDLLNPRWARDDAADLTLFKAMGMGVSDLALGLHVLNWARHNGAGRGFRAPQRVSLRLRAD